MVVCIIGVKDGWSNGLTGSVEVCNLKVMKKILLSLLVLGVLVVATAKTVKAQDSLVSVPVNNFSLLIADWRDRLQLWTTFDEEKKAEIELRIIERYEDLVAQVEALPDEADKEKILSVLEERRDHWLDSLETRYEQKDEVKMMLQERLGDLENAQQLRERLMEQSQEQVQERVEEMQQNRDEMQDQMREHVDEMQEDVEQNRDEMQTRMEEQINQIKDKGVEIKNRIEEKIYGEGSKEQSYKYESEDGSVRVENNVKVSGGDGSYASAKSEVVVNSDN